MNGGGVVALFATPLSRGREGRIKYIYIYFKKTPLAPFCSSGGKAATATTTQTLGRPHAYYYNSNTTAANRVVGPSLLLRTVRVIYTYFMVIVFTIVCICISHTIDGTADRGKSLRYAPPRGAPVIFTCTRLRWQWLTE